MAKTNLTINFLAKPSETNADELMPIYCRFKVGDSYKKEISANIRVRTENWDGEQILHSKGASKVEKELVKAQNQTLSDLKTRLWEAFNQLVATSRNVTITTQALKDHFTQKNVGKTFKDCFVELAKTKKNLPYAMGRAEIACNRFEEFLLTNYKTMLLCEVETMTDINKDFHDYCLHTVGWRGSYIEKMFYHIRNCFKIAYNKKWISERIEFAYTFSDGGYRLKEYLTLPELNTVRLQKMPTPTLERYRDLFVFQCCTGLSYSDMKKITYDDIKEVDGQSFLKDYRQKTKVEYNIPLLETAMQIIERYKEDSDRLLYHSEYALPVKANSNYNEYLKRIMQICGIDKSISTHSARYTCNMLLFKAGVKDEVRKHILGHGTVKMTHHYTFKDPEVLSKAMKKIEFKD